MVLATGRPAGCYAMLLVSLCCLLVIEEARGEDCGCTNNTLPHPRIVLLGPTGVGKSTFGNRLFGISEDNGGTEALCGQLDHFGSGPFRFGVGHGAESHTDKTSWMVGHYLGDTANPCITIIDTPGTGDTEGRDCDHGIALAEGLKEIGSIDAFMLLFKGTNQRFSNPMQEQIGLYKNIFGDKMFENVITEFTYWPHDRRSIKTRFKKVDNLTDEKKHDIWNREYANRFSVPRIIPSVFIDPVYDAEIADDTETKIDKDYTDKLLQLITQNFTEFQCDKRCKAPSGFFSGQPLLFEENELQNKRLGDRAAITWQIWLAGCDGSGTKSYTISHQPLEGAETILYDHKEDVEDDEVVTDESGLLRGMNVSDEPAEKFKTIRLTIESVEDQHVGSYYIQNDKGESNLGQLKKIVDGEWEAWGTFGACSKTCVSGYENPGIMRRHRVCKPPQNGGLDCKGEETNTKTCAHLPGQEGEVFRQCPIDAKWSSWSSDWSQCNSNCLNKGARTPFRSRTRICIPEQYGGMNCAFIEDQAKKNKEPLDKEKQNCTELPKCPKSASMGPWSSWSPCSVTCFPESKAPPQTSRTRPCKERVPSSDSTLNGNVVTCQDLGGQTETNTCPNIDACPVDAVWKNWSDWSMCTFSCGSEGVRTRSRAFVAGRHGGLFKPVGKETGNEPCNRNVLCPVPATYTWSEWSSCDIECYRPDSYRGMRTKTESCKDGVPQHPTDNCDKVPGGDLKLDMGCPSIGPCFSLTEIYGKIGGGGTDTSVYLKLKNSGTTEQCKTNVLDSKGNSWVSESWDKYTNKYDELNPCSNFYPSTNKLLFNIECHGHLNLKEITLTFNNTVFQWKNWRGRWFGTWDKRNDWLPMTPL